MGPRIPRTRSDSHQHVQWQLTFLRTSAELYEAGWGSEALRMATALRILLLDEGTNKSLLGQVEMLGGPWLDTVSTPRQPFGFLHVSMPMGYGVRYEAPILLMPGMKWTDFHSWWTADLLNDSRGEIFSRRDIVKSVAAMDGGAHVDKTLKANYHGLSRELSMQHPARTSQLDVVRATPVWEVLRQIVFELQCVIYAQTRLMRFFPNPRWDSTEKVPTIRFGGISIPQPDGSEVTGQLVPPSAEDLEKFSGQASSAAPSADADVSLSSEQRSRFPLSATWELPIGHSSSIVTWRVEHARLLMAFHAKEGNRWRHIQAVGNKAERLLRRYPNHVGPHVVIAAWLHDIGDFAPIANSGLHALGGAQFLLTRGVPSEIVNLVAHHSGASVEAAERSLIPQLEAFPSPARCDLDVLMSLDMTTGPEGQDMEPAERFDEILQRYDSSHVVHRAVMLSRAEMQRSCDRAIAYLNQPI